MRKLAIVSGAYVFAIFLAHELLPASWLFPLAAFLIFPGFALILMKRRWLLPVVLCLFAMSAGFYLYGMNRMLKADAVSLLDGMTVDARAEVLTVPEVYEEYARAEIALRTEDGKTFRTILYDRSFGLSGAIPGDTITGAFRLHAADKRYGERYDNYFARGVYLTAGNRGSITLFHSNRPGWRHFVGRVNGRLTAQIERIFSADTIAFFQGLLLGDKANLYQDDGLYYAMSRSGFMHIAAVSGMHIAFLIGMLQSLMGNTRKCVLVSLVLIWLYVFVTGASPSAMRAAIMLSVSQLAPIFHRENDPVTSLLFALALLLTANPFAAGSISLQLSFSSIAGIMLFAEKLRSFVYGGLPGWMPRIVRSYLASNTANSLSVLVFSVPLSGLYFGYVTVLSPIANLLALWAVPLCFGGGLFSCAVSLFWLPAGRLLAELVSWLARYILWIVRGCAAIDFSCLYFSLPANRWWVAAVYLLSFTFSFLPLAKWKKGVYPAALAVSSLLILLTVTRLYYGNAVAYFTAVDVGQGQSVVAFAGENTVVIDCGNSGSLENAGDQTGSYLKSRGREDIDLLILTHLHTDHANGVRRLLEYMPVKTIVLGKDMDDPAGMLPEILHAAEAHGTELVFLESDEQYRLDDLQVLCFAPGAAGDINERCLTVKISVGGAGLLVTGDMDMDAERELLRKKPIRGIDWLIVGHHGSKYAGSVELLEGIGADKAIVSSGYNTYGHPAEETLERLARFGYTVYRTDEDGTIEIRIP